MEFAYRAMKPRRRIPCDYCKERQNCTQAEAVMAERGGAILIMIVGYITLAAVIAHFSHPNLYCIRNPADAIEAAFESSGRRERGGEMFLATQEATYSDARLGDFSPKLVF